MDDARLIERFVNAFARLDDMTAVERIPDELDGGFDDSPCAVPLWKPNRVVIDSSALVELYRFVPGPFPPLYEQLILSYRWLDVDLRSFVSLLPNAPGAGLSDLQRHMTTDRAFVEVLFPVGLAPFARPSGGSYDPFCFDTSRRQRDGDCPIVRVEHEALLCDLRLGEMQVVFPSFCGLVNADLTQVESA